ncbi:MAG TPA: protein-glutamate O-methyltransferase CheR [Polyangiaceae bacterium]|nr:protein-glutamate O-methyltransferase CheR [Polyangiaceae bacterium]
MSAPEFDFVRDLVYRKSAIVIETGKEYLVESRLAPVARAEGFASIDEMVGQMRSQPSNGLSAKIVEAMTTNETSFFRDTHPFDALKTQIVPALLKARTTRTIRIWSAACSTGQEAYSIAMTLREHFPELATWDLQIFCSDLSSVMVARTKQGIFSEIEVKRGLTAIQLVKYFDREGTEYRAKPILSGLLECKQINLAEPWPLLPKFDVVFLRNVLIYFDVPAKKKILASVRNVLAPDGYLFLGTSETTFKIDEVFRKVMNDKSTYYRLEPTGRCV